MLVVRRPILRNLGAPATFLGGSFFFAVQARWMYLEGESVRQFEGYVASIFVATLLVVVALGLCVKVIWSEPTLIADEHGIQIGPDPDLQVRAAWSEIRAIRHTYEDQPDYPAHASEGGPSKYHHLCLILNEPERPIARIGRYDLGRPVPEIIEQLELLPWARDINFSNPPDVRAAWIKRTLRLGFFALAALVTVVVCYLDYRATHGSP